MKTISITLDDNTLYTNATKISVLKKSLQGSSFTYYIGKFAILHPVVRSKILVGVVSLDFEEFDISHYLTRIQLLNTETHQQELKDLEFNFIELPKFTKREHKLTTVLEKWIYFLKHADELGVIPESADTDALWAGSGECLSALDEVKEQHMLKIHGIPLCMLGLSVMLFGVFPVQADVQHPFPQHVVYIPGSIKPSHVTQTHLDNAVTAFYATWKTQYLTSGDSESCQPGRYYVRFSPTGL